MKNAYKLAALTVGILTFFSACAPAVSNLKIEKDLAESFSLTDSNKRLIADGLQDVYVQGEKEGVTLKVLQTITYGSLMRGVLEIESDKIPFSLEEGTGVKLNISFAERASLGMGGSCIPVDFDEEKGAYVYTFSSYLRQQVFEEGDKMCATLEKIYNPITLPPEAYDEEGQLKEGYEQEQILWQTEEPLTVTWEIEKIGNSLEIDIEDDEFVNGKIELNPLYLRVSAYKSPYGFLFVPYSKLEEGYCYFCWMNAMDIFEKTVKLRHKDGYFMDIFRIAPISEVRDETGGFDVMKTFFMPLDMDSVEAVRIMQREYKIRTAG